MKSETHDPRTLRRCPAEDHEHSAGRGLLRQLATPALREAVARRTPLGASLVDSGLLEELDRRWCAAGPRVLVDGKEDRLAASEFALWPPASSHLAGEDGSPDRPDARLSEHLESLQRVMGIQAAVATLDWLSAGGPTGALIHEIDDPWWFLHS